MRRILLSLVLTSLAAGQTATQATVTLVSVQKMNIGEAYDCPSIDWQWKEAHCFKASTENVQAPKHKYLVKATFDKPVHPDKDGWAWDFTCRLDSYKTATCQVNTQVK